MTMRDFYQSKIELDLRILDAERLEMILIYAEESLRRLHAEGKAEGDSATMTHAETLSDLSRKLRDRVGRLRQDAYFAGQVR